MNAKKLVLIRGTETDLRRMEQSEVSPVRLTPAMFGTKKVMTAEVEGDEGFEEMKELMERFDCRIYDLSNKGISKGTKEVIVPKKGVSRKVFKTTQEIMDERGL